MSSNAVAAVWLVLIGLVADADAGPRQSPTGGAPPAPTLPAAQDLFFSGKYEDAAAMALALRAANPDDLASYELRTSALHFQIKRLMGDAEDKGRAYRACAECPALFAEFMKDVAAGQKLARAELESNENDEAAQFFLGKIDLNYVWMQLGTLGKRTGWSEYWEARRSVDAVLKRNPAHVRARVARAWIDYIVDTKMPFGTAWLLGGGSKKKGLAAVREAADAPADRFVQAEARFALWEMLVREKNIPEALVVVRRLAQDFPGNQDITKFLDKHDKKSEVRSTKDAPAAIPAPR
jgi:hypothetical protein